MPKAFTDHCSLSGDCVVWVGPRTGKYGSWKGRYAHRIAYETAHGAIPDGMEIHHECRNKLCVNPDHLRAVSRREHYAIHTPSHCRRGHEMSGENLYIAPSGARQCKACRKLRRPEPNGKKLGWRNAAKTHCKHGHPFDEQNTIVRPNGSRACRECSRARCRDWYGRTRAN